MALSTTLTDNTPQAGLHTQQHNEANADIISILAQLAGGVPGGLPTGGSAGQVPTKVDNTNYNVTWATPSPGTTAAIGSPWQLITVNPGDSWATALATNPSNTTFIAKAGTHSQQFLTLTAGTNDNISIYCEPGCKFDGGMSVRTITASFTASGTAVTSAALFTAADFSATTPTIIWGGPGWTANAGTAIVGSFVNSSSAVTDDNAFSTGPFTVTLVRPPVQNCDHFVTGNAKNFSMYGGEVKNYAVPRNRAAIWPRVFDDATNAGENWDIRSVYIHDNSNGGIGLCDNMAIVKCLIYNNGDIGITGGGNGFLVERNEISFNNAYNNINGFDASGMKVAFCTGGKVLYNHVHDNKGAGLWGDVQAIGVEFFGNIVHDNAGTGIQYETSYSGDIHGNIVWNCGVAGNNSIFVGGAQILISASSHVKVYENEINTKGNHLSSPTGNYNGICVLMQDRNKGGGVNQVVTDANISSAATTFTSAASAQFTTQHVGAYLQGTANVVYIQKVISTTSATLSGPPGTTITNGSLTLGVPGDNYGWTGVGQSNVRQRAYDIDIYRNNIRTTGTNMTAAGFITDTSESFLIGAYDSMLIGFRENNYNCPGGQSNWSWGGNNVSLDAWRGFGNDKIKAIQTLTPNQGSWSLPAVEYIHDSGNPSQLNTVAQNINMMPVNFWTPTTSVFATSNFFSTVRPSIPNGFIYQCTTGGTTAGSPPAFPTTIGATVTETGGVVWKNLGVDPAAVSGAVTVDFSSGNTQILYATAAITSMAATNLPYNQTVEIHIVNGTTANAVTWATSASLALNGGVAVPAPGASKRAIWCGYSDGSTVHEKWRSNPA